LAVVAVAAAVAVVVVVGGGEGEKSITRADKSARETITIRQLLSMERLKRLQRENSLVIYSKFDLV
jgi:hypothetical protein